MEAVAESSLDSPAISIRKGQAFCQVSRQSVDVNTGIRYFITGKQSPKYEAKYKVTKQVMVTTLGQQEHLTSTA